MPDDMLGQICADPEHRQQVVDTVRAQVASGTPLCHVEAIVAVLATRVASIYALHATRSAYAWWSAKVARETLQEIAADEPVDDD